MPFAGKTPAERYESEKRYLERMRADPERYAKHLARIAKHRRDKRHADPENKAATYAANNASMKRRRAMPDGWQLAEIRRIKHRAKERGLSFDLEVGDIEVPAFCPVLGIPITLGAPAKSPGLPSV